MAVANYRNRRGRRAGRIVAAAGASIIRRSMQGAFSRLKDSFTKNKENPQKSVTEQHDMQVQKFRSKKFSRGSKKKKMFQRRVLNALSSYSNPSWMRFYDAAYSTTTEAGQQKMFVIGSLYGLGGSAGGSDNRDLEQIFTACQPKGNAHTAAGGTAAVFDASDNKLRIQSAYLESTIKAESTYSTAVVDVYECMCRKTMTGYNTLVEMLLAMPSQSWPGAASFNSFASVTLGITPFQSPPGS